MNTIENQNKVLAPAAQAPLLPNLVSPVTDKHSQSICVKILMVEIRLTGIAGLIFPLDLLLMPFLY